MTYCDLLSFLVAAGASQAGALVEGCTSNRFEVFAKRFATGGIYLHGPF